MEQTAKEVSVLNVVFDLDRHPRLRNIVLGDFDPFSDGVREWVLGYAEGAGLKRYTDQKGVLDTLLELRELRRVVSYAEDAQPSTWGSSLEVSEEDEAEHAKKNAAWGRWLAGGPMPRE